MYKDFRYINAGQNEFYRYGKKAVAMIEAGLTPNAKGYCSIPANGGKYYTFGTSEGQYGEFARHGSTYFSINRGGYIYVKVDSPKYGAYVEMLKGMIEAMNKKNAERTVEDDEEE